MAKLDKARMKMFDDLLPEAIKVYLEAKAEGAALEEGILKLVEKLTPETKDAVINKLAQER